jgi:hypothetical protein
MKIGPKELAQRDLQAKKCSRAHEMMLEDGCPEKILRTGDGPKLKPRADKSTGVTLAAPLAVQKAISAEFADDETETTNAPAPPAAEQQETAMSMKKTKTKKTAKPKKAPKASKPKVASAPKEKNGGVRPGSKTEIVANLLKRPEGCTTADILAATGWPAVSVPAMAKAAGLTLKKEKNKGEPTRYRAA